MEVVTVKYCAFVVEVLFKYTPTNIKCTCALSGLFEG